MRCILEIMSMDDSKVRRWVRNIRWHSQKSIGRKLKIITKQLFQKKCLIQFRRKELVIEIIFKCMNYIALKEKIFVGTVDIK